MTDPEPLGDWLHGQGQNYLRRLKAKKPRTPRDPSKPKAKRAAPERDAQKAVVKWLRLWGHLVAASENERRSNSDDPNAQARFQAMRKASGVTPGWPDLAIALPGGRTAYVEMKAERGRLSEAQNVVHARLRALGHVVVVARSVFWLAPARPAAAPPERR